MTQGLLKSILILIALGGGPLHAGISAGLDDDDTDATVCVACKAKTSNFVAQKIAVPKDVNSELRAIDDARSARVTFYDPNQNNRLEGGPRTRYGERINSIEDAIQNGRPVTVAADTQGTFGATCNRRESRCLMLIHMAGLDSAYPGYRKKFPNLPRNTFVAIVEDTGSAFRGTGGRRFDIAARNRAFARAIPMYINSRVTAVRLKNPCGQGSSGRACNLAESAVSDRTLVAMGLNNPST